MSKICYHKCAKSLLLPSSYQSTRDYSRSETSCESSPSSDHSTPPDCYAGWTSVAKWGKRGHLHHHRSTIWMTGRTENRKRLRRHCPHRHAHFVRMSTIRVNLILEALWRSEIRKLYTKNYYMRECHAFQIKCKLFPFIHFTYTSLRNNSKTLYRLRKYVWTEALTIA